MIQRNEFSTLGEYIDLALQRELLSETGEYVIIIRIGSSKNPSEIIGYKLAYPNETSRLFTSREAVRNYVEVCSEFEPDLKRSGCFLMKRV